MAKRARILAVQAALSLVITVGCGEQDAAAPESDEVALRAGATGDVVAKVNTYLLTYGYFPNSALAEKYPGWVPFVTEGPKDVSKFDESTQQGLLAFQSNAHLPLSGMIDSATLAAIETPRCGVPDSAGGGWASDGKWAAKERRWPTSTVTYTIDTTGVPAGKKDIFVHDVEEAFWAWGERSDIGSFKLEAGGAISIGWTTLKPPPAGGDTLGSAGCGDNGITTTSCSMYFNNALSGGWTFSNEALKANATHFPSVALHEVGHALGLEHSSVGTPVMFFNIADMTARDRLQIDDVQGIHAINPGHMELTDLFAPPPDSSSVVAGRDSEVWIVAGSYNDDGGQIFKRNPDTSWAEHPFGGMASMLAWSGSKLWHVNNGGKIYREGAGAWEEIDGAASHIAASHNVVFHLSKDVTRGSSDRDIYRFNNGTNGWDHVDGSASDIAVANDSNGNTKLWYINEYGEVWRQDALDDGSHAEALAVQPPDGACGISAGQDDAVYVLSCPYDPSGMAFYVWNEQPANDQLGDSSDTPRREGWVRIPGTARDVTSTRDRDSRSSARIYHVGTSGLWVSR